MAASRARPVRVMGAHGTRRARQDRGRAYERAVDVGRRRMSPLCSSPCSSLATSFRRLPLTAAMVDAEAARGERPVRSGSSGVTGARDMRDALVRSGSSDASGACGTCGTHWCGRARRVRAGHVGRRGTPGVCRRWRRNSACVAGVVTKHDATGIGAPGRVRGLDHAHDNDNDRSCNNSDDGEVMT